MATVSVEHATVRLGDPPRTVIDAVSVALDSGTITLVIGANGSGKSVFLRSLLGLEPLADGKIRFDDVPLSRKSRRALHRASGVTFQNSDVQIFGDTVRDDLEIGSRSGDARSSPIIEDFGLAPLLDRSPFELSGGQRRRLALAGALIDDPPYLFLDEPFLELDYPHIRTLVRHLQSAKERGQTVIVASHETRDMWEIADVVLVFSHGRIVAEGPPATVREAIGPDLGLRPVEEGR